ncbi:reverse transcriptase domain-containing protein [Tanacetum coccineum]
MMASIDEDVEKSSLADQDDVGSGVSSSGQNKSRKYRDSSGNKTFDSESQITEEEQSAKYDCTSHAEMAMYLDSEAPLSSLDIPPYIVCIYVVFGMFNDGHWSKLCNLLQRSLDIFAWTPTDMTGVPRQVAKHKLNVRKGCPPVRQKKRGQAAERNIAINDEVNKLVAAGIMREVHYHDWLSNPVMVKKSDNSWRMCVDFKDLNKACPKDGYPLSEIDWKVESLCGFPFKCFLDAYKGYHQIQMAEEDEEKTAFIINQGIFCYTKMPFGLRNAGATYQRLVDKTFHG